MGNHQSQQPQSPVDVVRRPPTRPEAPPSARPISQLGPNGPSYHSPENLVLPKEIPIMKLRPVSMELSKYNPEYQDIYGYKDNEDLENEQENEDKSETVENFSKSPPRPPPPSQNGHIPNSALDKDRPVSQVSPVQNGNVKTEPKKVKINENVAYRPTHRRQMSASGSSNLTGQEHIIFEEPEESIDMRGKIDPLYQSYPGVSLPVKNNFNLDYSYQLTYVQLAEHRRQKTLEELERKTGKKISELSADLNENVEKPPFMRDEYSRVSTRSTGSTGSGLTNKKKKAPAPPSQPPPGPPAPPSKSGVPIQKPKTPVYSPENEPIPDYDLGESPKRQFILPRYTVGPVPKNVPPPTPPQPNISKPKKKEVSVKRTNSMQEGRPEIILKKTPSINTLKTSENMSGHIPWLLEMKHISESKAARRQISQDSAEVEPPPAESKETDSEYSKLKTDIPLNSSQTKLVFESSKGDFKVEMPDLAKDDTDKEEIFALEELDKSIGEVNNDSVVEEKPHERKGSLTNEKPASPKLARHHSSTVFDRKSTPAYERANSSPGDPVRRLNSLLQHDIKVTAKAKCHKLVKPTTPVPPKPKDPHEIFREILAKACVAREERVKVEGTIDEQLKPSASDANLGKVLDSNDENKLDTQSQASNMSNDSNRKESERKNSSNEPPEVKPKPPRYHKNVTLNKTNISQPAWKQKSKSGGSNNFEPPHKAAAASFDWTPEVDLDSDDNLSDREEISMRKGASEGFKSSIIPSTVLDLKSQKKQKGGKYKKQAPEPSEAEPSTKTKFGSVKKLKKSVHKGVRNAFGSISKASGKLLRKQRTEEMETVDNAPKNWKFEKTPEMKRSKSLDNYDRYRMSNGYAVSDSEYDGHSEAESIQNGAVNSDDETSDDGIAEQIAQNIKRAGIAYVNDKGELVVLPDDKTAENDSKEIKHDKKKRRNKKQDKAHGENLREKERKIEEERRKQLELELEMHKIREAETRERLQRLEAAQLQQQISAQIMQRQQQQNYTMLTAPPLPPAGVFPPNYSSRTDTQQTAGFPNLYNQQLPQNPYLSNPGLYSQPTGPLLNGSAPNLTYNLEDYMRMLGLQTPPTSQQMAFFLNNMTLNGMNGLNGFPQQSDRKSNPILYDILHPEPMKQSCGMQAIDPSANKYNMWSSSPNLNNEQTSEPKDTVINDFVASYQSNGAKEMDRQASKSRNPLYSSDDSDSGLSPSRTMARAQVPDFRPIPVRTESGKFMKKYSRPLRDFEDSKSVPDFDLPHNHVNEIPLRQRGGSGSVSPTNSLSTNDSTAVSSSDTPSSPGKYSDSQYSPAIATKIYGPTGFKTVVDFSKGSGSNGQVT